MFFYFNQAVVNAAKLRKNDFLENYNYDRKHNYVPQVLLTLLL